MDNNEYLRQAQIAGRLYGGRLGDKLAYQASQPCASKDIARSTLAPALQAATTAIAAKSTAPYIQTDAQAAWRDAAMAVVVERVTPATNLALISALIRSDPPVRFAVPIASDFDVSVS